MKRKSCSLQRSAKALLPILVLLTLVACSTGPAAEPGPSYTVPGEDSRPGSIAGAIRDATVTAAPTVPPTPAPTQTPVLLPTPTSTPTPTASPAPTLTPTQTVTPTPQHPLAIEYMRAQAYPGSELTIEQKLEPGANYDRYIASYLSEGFKIYALLTVPRGQKPDSGWPLVIFNHGHIPPAQYRTTERYVAYVDAVARNGYIVFRSDYRGHGNSEGEAANGYSSPAYTIDVLNAVETIKHFPDADPDRIGMWGHSMGGGITLRIMVTTADVKAGVIWAGTVASFAELFDRRWAGGSGGDSPLPPIDPDSGRWQWLPEMNASYGTPEENPAFYASISPNSYLSALSGPIQLHHGTDDTSVPAEYSELLATQIEAVGKPVELYTYPGDNHNISANFGRAMARSIRFFDEYVKGVDGE